MLELLGIEQPPQMTGRSLLEQRMSWSQRLLAAFFIGAGVNHFVMPRAYEQIVPPRLQGDATRLVQVERRGRGGGRPGRAAASGRAGRRGCG